MPNATTQPPNDQPNVLLVMTDQHAPDISGFAGHDLVETQNLDRLASRSTRFSNAICPSPVCTPSRISMLTAKEPHRCSAWGNHWPIFPEHRTWPEHFADHGYRTALIGKMHLGGKDQMVGFQDRPYGDLRHGLSHQPEPIDRFPGYQRARSAGITEIPESLLQDVVVTRETLSLLREHNDTKPSEPWFVCASYSRPHDPYTAPGRYIRNYQGTVSTVECPDPGQLDPYSRRYHRDDLSDEERRRGREAYFASVDFVDDCIGELLTGLEDDGILDNTIVIYTSDHGEMAGRRGIWGKVVYHDPSIGVPLLVSGPDIPSESTIEDPISLIDLFPTTCGLADLPTPEDVDGVDFSEVLRAPETASAPRQYVTSERYCYGVPVETPGENPDPGDSYSAMRLVTDGEWKYITFDNGAPLLFDLQADPEETTNLAEDPEHASMIEELSDVCFEGFSWDNVHEQLETDLDRLSEVRSGERPTTPNQYVLDDGRMFDAEVGLYDARWLYVPPDSTGGIIPQERH